MTMAIRAFTKPNGEIVEGKEEGRKGGGNDLDRKKGGKKRTRQEGREGGGKENYTKMACAK